MFRYMPALLPIVLALGCDGPAPVGPLAGIPLSASLPAADEPSPSVRLQGAMLFYDGFEGGLDRWTIAGDLGGVSWHRLNATTCGGAWVMRFGLLDGGPFSAGEATIGLKEPLDLTRARRPHLTYDVMGRATPDAGLTLQPEARRAGEAWRPVGSVARARYAAGFTRFADLTAYAGGMVELRFRAVAEGLASPAEGLYLDQVQVIEPD